MELAQTVVAVLADDLRAVEEGEEDAADVGEELAVGEG